MMTARKMRSPKGLLPMRSLQRSSTSWLNYRVKRLTTPKRIGLMMKLIYFSGPSKSTAEARASLHRSWTRMTGSKSLGSSQEEMIHSASTSSTKIRSQPYRRVTGSKEKTKSSWNWSVRMVPSNGLRSQTNSMLALGSPGTASSAGRGGSTSSTLKSKRILSVSEKIFLFSKNVFP
jgi:hypothetical protein